MSNPRDNSPNRDRLDLFLSAPHPCNYLPDKQTINLVADPRIQIDTRLYSALMEQGFRRSGEFTYRPRCPRCEACVSIRVPVATFKPRRSQRRVLQRNQDVILVAREAEFDPEHFALYQRYLSARHAGGGMDNPAEEDYLRFLTAARIDTVFYELRGPDGLLGVAVADRLSNGLSAVYSFFDPEASRRSPGVLAILYQIADARRLGLDYLYLGYWIADCDKMNYKTEYQPAEGFVDGRWGKLNETEQSG